MSGEARLAALARPPRNVPISLRIRLRLGGPLGIIGWSLLAFGGVFVVVFGALSESYDLAFAEHLPTVSGEALGWRETSTQVNDQPVVETGFVYEVDGARYEGASYATAHGLSAGDPVTVEYLPGDPSRARIVGMRDATMPWWVTLICLPFPLIGLGFAFANLVRGGRTVRLLSEGRATGGRLVDSRQTNTRINNRYVVAMTFEFEDERGRTHRVEARTTEPSQLRDEALEPLLYDPARPDRAVLIDSLPGLLRPTQQGHWAGPGAGAAVGALVAPAIAAVVVSVGFLLSLV
ncbi:MAG: DUF3592 domain-containing protein [Myxococcales bacterium]|nr:DUF3592 domain-containing protein [Myxococcales bacterium]